MKFSFRFLILAAALSAAACDRPAPTTPPATDVEVAAPPGASTTPESDAYTIRVLKPDLASPRKEMTASLSGATLVINYGSPATKGRTIWGELVPYGKVWRTGANEATSFTTSANILVEGQPLPAGKYGLYTIPGETSWTVIFNRNPDQWGAYDYDAAQDVIRVQVTPRTNVPASENLEFKVQGNEVFLHWGTLQAPFRITGA